MGEYGAVIGNILVGLGLVVVGGVLRRRMKTGIFCVTLDENGNLPPVAPYSRTALTLVGAGAVAVLVGVALILIER